MTRIDTHPKSQTSFCGETHDNPSFQTHVPHIHARRHADLDIKVCHSAQMGPCVFFLARPKMDEKMEDIVIRYQWLCSYSGLSARSVVGAIDFFRPM